MKKIIVASSQFNYKFGNNIQIPFSIAQLITYVKSKPELSSNFEFMKTCVFRSKIDDYIQNCKNCDIFLCSCYVWNWEITKYLAKNVKAVNPKCLVILGGPQVPDKSTGFFEKHPFVDILVHGEGEITLEDILQHFVTDRKYDEIKGISTKEFNTSPRERIQDFSILPSPYLSNTVWELVDKVDGIRWDVSWETNRGCPYACTFCDWGSATLTKLRKFSDEKISKEIEWFSNNKINYIFCCDANFGIFYERDLEIAQKLSEVSMKTNYPETFFTNWAKNSSEKIIPIASELQKSGLLTGITLSVQSLDKNTLDIIKRANIKFDEFSDLAETFRSHGFSTYSEIIRGLPGETLQSFNDGLENMIGKSNIEEIYIFHCSLLPNAPMNLPEYREKYKIKSIKSPIFIRHAKLHEEKINEFEYIITETESFSFKELKEMFINSWIILTFHNLGILEYVAKFYNKSYPIKLMKFYSEFHEFCIQEESLFSNEYKKMLNLMNSGYSGKGWDHYDMELSDINWPIEEASWLRLTTNKDRLRNDILYFIQKFEKKYGYSTPKDRLEDLVNFQIFLLGTYDKDQNCSMLFKYDWEKFFVENKVDKTNVTYFYENPIFESDYKEWCKKTMWLGRHNGLHKCNIKKLNKLEKGSALKNNNLVDGSDKITRETNITLEECGI